MQTVKDILLKNSKPFLTIQAHESVLSAIQLLEKYDQGAVMVFEGKSLVGIFSERDYTRKVALKNKNSSNTRVSEIMSRDICAIGPEKTPEDCLAMMNDGQFRHLPVVDGDEVLGFISILDVANSLISEKLKTIDQLKTYVSETWPF